MPLDFTPPTERLDFYRNVTHVFTAEITNSEGLLEDLTGVTATMNIRATKDSPDVLLALTPVIVCEKTGDLVTESTITVTLPASAWESINWLKGVYDLKLNYPSDIVVPILKGEVIVHKDVP